MGFSAIFDYHLGPNMFASSFPSIQKSTLESKYGTPPKINGWNLKIIPWKRRNIDPNHQFLGFHVSFQGCNKLTEFWKVFLSECNHLRSVFSPEVMV